MLGLPNRDRRSYRNHFCASAGHTDYLTLLAMSAAGYLRRKSAQKARTVEDLWFLTEAAARLALDKGERLDLEDFPGELAMAKGVRS
jgi:hypothetical protein